MRTLLWSYLGWRRFPRELSAFEVRHFFSLTRRDREALRKRIRTRARLGAAIQLGFVRMTGTMLEALEHVPRAVFAHVAHQLALPAPELGTLRALYGRRSTLFEHQSWACAYAGLHWPEVADVTAVVESLVADSAGTLDRHRLARAARTRASSSAGSRLSDPGRAGYPGLGPALGCIGRDRRSAAARCRGTR